MVQEVSVEDIVVHEILRYEWYARHITNVASCDHHFSCAGRTRRYHQLGQTFIFGKTHDPTPRSKRNCPDSPSKGKTGQCVSSRSSLRRREPPTCAMLSGRNLRLSSASQASSLRFLLLSVKMPWVYKSALSQSSSNATRAGTSIDDGMSNVNVFLAELLRQALG